MNTSLRYLLFISVKYVDTFHCVPQDAEHKLLVPYGGSRSSNPPCTQPGLRISILPIHHTSGQSSAPIIGPFLAVEREILFQISSLNTPFLFFVFRAQSSSLPSLAPGLLLLPRCSCSLFAPCPPPCCFPPGGGRTNA